VTLAIRRHLRDHRRRLLALAVVVLLGVALWSAHATPAEHHMGKAMAVCLAVAVVATASVAALPVLGRLVPGIPRPRRSGLPRLARGWAPPPFTGRARGDPAVLQVFRR
jgi:NhaP-type Na+/H+ or K+/H+ antiporter